eukprot:TRINITY_DN559_c0_g1_i1.p1 TRINITY_DN559_c0_g1~~TRINITY_DN559_c0_g1_i1.p1  ORF type:complete len:116 (-),score=6.98 TRINITY_DN559_c0_g1_i1:51-398(-)
MAFQKMRDNASSAVAVVDDSDRLIDVLSVSDLKILGENMDKVHLITESVEEFVRLKSDRIPPVLVTPLDTVGHVSQLFLQDKIHRVYVVDSEQSRRPIGVIGLQDFLTLFLPKQQ